MASPALKQHPQNPYGVLVPCANCGREIHIPKTEAEEIKDFSKIACSWDCKEALKK